MACSGQSAQRPEAAEETSAGDRVGPLLEGMGDHHHAITTDSPEAQRFFDQGIVLAYGFNHLEAERSFREAARLDPDCAMCYWGVAFVRGPNINSLMDPENGWPLFGLQQSLAAQGKTAEAEEIGQRFAAAWQYADVELTASRF